MVKLYRSGYHLLNQVCHYFLCFIVFIYSLVFGQQKTLLFDGTPLLLESKFGENVGLIEFAAGVDWGQSSIVFFSQVLLSSEIVLLVDDPRDFTC